ncbi:hypothetical protein [Microvirga sp. VF16]|uniref:hypothetical protein n=1 Tax=Microvirga sp. VF16 TaxID=2807101 RepID=UPI00193D8B36|nr:hypothetical protein [Microvirga sp. VF16]QRM27886.1 hypothetical protein JO965_16685 [Microvirga sp. VF16]
MMYGDFFLVEKAGIPSKRAVRLPIGDTGGRNEAWLRDTLFSNPELLPINDIDPSFGPLLPLCRELRTEAGPLDIAYINPTGRLTLVECKLWRNPEARRKVVAQVLDYARAISRWSYSDLQRQVSMATGRQGNIPFELAKAVNPTLVEHQFADAVVRTMRSGRFLLLIAGDGIREDIGALAELINRNAALGFSFGLVEVGLYDLGAGDLAIQPRVTARTHVFERNVVIYQTNGSVEVEEIGSEQEAERIQSADSVKKTGGPGGAENPKQAEYRRWWQPVLDMSFDDPDQEPLKLYWPNNVRAQLPWPGTWITAYQSTKTCGVFLAGREHELEEVLHLLSPQLDQIASELPEGTEIGNVRSSGGMAIKTTRLIGTFKNDDEKREWLKPVLNQYVNVLRPRLKQLVE